MTYTAYTNYIYTDKAYVLNYGREASPGNQGWIPRGGGGGAPPPPPHQALARGAGGVLFFMIKQNIIRGKMIYSNLSNNMMISEL
jgi:hypothetical protein